MLQNMLDVTVTAVQNNREHHNPVKKGFVETVVVPNYCDQHLPPFQDENTNISDEG